MVSFESGDEFTAEVDRISNSGNGIIETENGHVNIGPVSRDLVGEKVDVEMVDGNFGICYEEDNAQMLNRLIDRNTPGSFNPLVSEGELAGKRVTVAPTQTIYGDHPNIESEGVPIANAEGRLLFILDGEVGKEDEVEIQSSDNLYAIGRVVSDSKGKEVAVEPSNERRKNSEEDGSLDFSDSGDNQRSDLVNLRNDAEESAVEEVPEGTTVSDNGTAEYTRSQAIRKYVMARADGSCEGCGEPAPFTSKTGNPYLHAHHIHELSNGGSDTPDTVIALCPNCHYRVHHGDDGDEYNQELLEIV